MTESDTTTTESSHSICEKCLQKAVDMLEQLNRDCFVLVREKWNVSDYSGLHDLVVKKIAECLSLLISKWRTDWNRDGCKCKWPDNENQPDPEFPSMRVFVALNYRGIHGGRHRSSNQYFRPEEYSKYTNYYGCLAEADKKMGLNDGPFFMPVAFMSFVLYEILPHQRGDVSGRLNISGFSRWMNKYGLLFCKDGPGEDKQIHGFHFSIGSGNPDIPNGRLLHCPFSDASWNSTNLTDRFNDAFKEYCHFSRGRTKEQNGIEFDWAKEKIDGSHLFPLVNVGGSDPSAPYREVAEALFLSFFRSNFRAATDACKNDIRKAADKLDREDIIRLQVEEVIKTYDAHVKRMQEEKGTALFFRHFYAFLLNPGLAFRDDVVDPKDKEASLGSLNFYSNVSIPEPLFVMIHKHLEVVVRLLRDVEEWKEGKNEGKVSESDRWNKLLGHEFTRAYASLAKILQNKGFIEALSAEARSLLDDYCGISLQIADIISTSRSGTVITEDDFKDDRSLRDAFEKCCAIICKFNLIKLNAPNLEHSICLPDSINDLREGYDNANSLIEVSFPECEAAASLRSVTSHVKIIVAKWLSPIALAVVGNALKHGAKDRRISVIITTVVENRLPYLLLEIQNFSNKPIAEEKEDGTFWVLKTYGQSLYEDLKLSWRFGQNDFCRKNPNGMVENKYIVYLKIPLYSRCG